MQPVLVACARQLIEHIRYCFFNLIIIWCYSLEFIKQNVQWFVLSVDFFSRIQTYTCYFSLCMKIVIADIIFESVNFGIHKFVVLQVIYTFQYRSIGNNLLSCFHYINKSRIRNFASSCYGSSVIPPSRIIISIYF